MIQINLKKVKTDLQIGDKPEANKSKHVVLRPTTIRVDGEVAIVYGNLGKDYMTVRSILGSINYESNTRMSLIKKDKDGRMDRKNAIRTNDISFGYRPSNYYRGLCAGAMPFNTRYPNWYKALCALGGDLLGKYKQYGWEKYGEHCTTLFNEIDPEWRIDGTPFTQGIINGNFALPYHYDAKNFPGNWSCMAVLTNQSKGGSLVIPSLDLEIKLGDGTFLLFDGQAIMHGVTPIKLTHTTSYRYSVVYYSVIRMRGLGTQREEMDKFNDRQTAISRKKISEER